MINRCIRYITLGFTQHIIDLEKMHLRARQHKVASSSFEDKTETTGLELCQTQKGASRTPDQAAAMGALLNEHKGAMLKESILKHHTEPILTRAQTLNQLNPFGEPHGLSHIGATRTLIIRSRQIT
ncbi:hypothetical protein PGTUg99_000896 [Puccinia graminis f. sp. tritici]|uniref:Uncharacterized protein n=1 Tax=Puccinia graminis f. sp. tritici TaxID=56615 RepID=A0A5B0RK07_PUCGR|nr:hypothetical protein PGTUg99_000896 [Puccinia graminis f. sp. tritici]